MIKKRFTYLTVIFLLIFFNLSPILAYLPNDPKFSEQKALNDIKITQAWDMTRGSEDVVIAVLDSGVDITHPDLKNNIWVNKGEISNDGLDNDKNGYIDDINGWDFVDNNNNPNPIFFSNYTEIGINHGTIISGLIAAQGDNGQGIIGVCPKCKIMPLKVLDNQGVGNTGAVIEAINYAIDKRVDVINMSFVGSNYSASLAEAVKKAYQAGIVLVVASGNDSLTEGDDLFIIPSYPICNDGDDNYVIGVAALDNKGQRAIFSNYGADFIDISAPGSSLFSTLVYSPENNSNEYYGGYWSGTSVATALVSGVAGLIKSLNPLFSPKQVRESIAKGAENIDLLNPSYKGKLGAGKLNAYNAVKDAYLRMASFSSSEYIVTGAGNGGGPHIRTFNSNGFPGSFNFFAYNENFRGGVNVAVGDIDGDGKAEIVTGAGNGGGPHVRVFDSEGKLKAHFFAYNENFRGGVNVAVGDIDGDGKAEIITGAGNGGGPHVRVFSGEGKAISGFFAFLDEFRGGVKVAVGDLNRDGKGEIIAGIASSANAYVRIFDSSARLKTQFLAYPKNFQGGLSLACGDLNNDGRAEIITGAGFGGSPQVRIFDSEGNPVSQFFAYDKNFRGGVNVALINKF